MLDEILLNIKRNTQAGNRSLAVFDLDSTLFDVIPRTHKILLDFAYNLEFQIKYPQQTTLLKLIQLSHIDWGVHDALTRISIHVDEEIFREDVTNFWKKNFFSNDYLQHDIPYEGAVDFVQKAHQFGAEIVYLTGRDIARMGDRSAEILEHWKFPLGEKADLVLKPHLSMNDASFKTQWFLNAKISQFANSYFFENEPVNINHTRQHCPDVELIFFDSIHSNKEQAPEELPRIVNFLTNMKE